MSDEKEMVGYRQQPGKLPFARPGSGGKNQEISWDQVSILWA